MLGRAWDVLHLVYLCCPSRWRWILRRKWYWAWSATMCGVHPLRQNFYRLCFHLMPPSPIWGGFTDLLEVLACHFGGEVGASGAGVDIEPVYHFSLVFCGGMLVSENVGDFAFFAVEWAWDGPLAGLRGTTWNAKEIPEESVFVRDGAGGTCEVCS